MNHTLRWTTILFLFAATLSAAAGFRAGVARSENARALALEDPRGSRVVIVTVDEITLSRELADFVAARIMNDYSLDRANLLLNVSRTGLNPRRLADELVNVVGAALGQLKAAQLSAGFGSADLVTNPVEHSVPVLRVTSTDGKLIAILFGYACDNSGDWASGALRAIEQEHPGATAMFLMLCGRHQLPQRPPEQLGKSIATEVERVLAGRLQPVGGPLRSAFLMTELLFPLQLRRSAEREALQRLPYPVQAIRFGRDLTILALGGEPVIAYAVRARREFPGNLVVAGYSNAVTACIPSQSDDNCAAQYDLPGPFSPGVEGRIFETIARAMNRVK